MANETLFLSAQGLRLLRQDEGEIDGLYDDPSGYCTFGVGHLVHSGDKWSCFMLQSAGGSEPWKAFVAKKWPGTSYETPYLQRTAAFNDKFSELKSLSVDNAKTRIATKKFGKEFSKLSQAEQAKATELAQSAVDEQARLLTKTVDDVLKDDVKPFERSVRDQVKVTLTQEEFDALVSFCFNVGGGNFASSSVLKEINKDQHKSGDAKQRAAAIKAIEDAFAKWNKSGGVVLAGLTKRRKSESDRFLKAARAALAELQKSPKPGVSAPQAP
jgi:GH24 family phage-related lysozyme (muramidase)